MKVYNKAEMRIVSVSNDIVTASNIQVLPGVQNQADRTAGRRSIWD